MIGRVLRKVKKGQATCQAEAVMIANPVKNDYQKSNSVTKSSKVLLSPDGKIHHQIQNSSLRPVAWLVSGKIYLQKRYQKRLSILSQIPEEQLLSQIMNRPGETGLAGAVGSKLILLVII